MACVTVEVLPTIVYVMTQQWITEFTEILGVNIPVVCVSLGFILNVMYLTKH